MNELNPGARMPERLDLNDWIQLSLHSEDEADRQIALEELVTTGVPPYLVSKIREISARDLSSVCRQLASWVESIENARAELKPQMRKLELSPVNIICLLENAESAMASVITQLLRKSPPEKILDQWRVGLETESQSKMIQIGLTLLGKFGKPTDADLVIPFLDHSDSEVICAALTFLQIQDLEKFKQYVRKGLTSRSFKIQLHAVHLLRPVDQEEAIKYIRAFLFHKNPLIRQKALRELMLAPFEKVENLFLEFLSRETQTLLLVKAGFVVVFNPSPSLPLKVFDIFQFARDCKKHILQLILRQLIESIQSAGILTQTIEEYMSDLKQKINFRRSELIIRCAIKDLASSDKTMRLSAIDRLAPYAEYPSIKQALTRHLENEKNIEVAAAIDILVGVQKVQVARNTGIPVSVEEFLKLEKKDQRQLLKNIHTDADWSASRKILTGLLQEQLKKNILLEIVKILGRFGSRIDSPPILRYLDNPDPSISAAVLKTLGFIDLDSILPHLNRFLAAEDPRIKSAALEVYVLADKEGAVQYLSSMLRSTAVATRRIGLSLLPQIDYSSAEPLLWKLLRYEGNCELKVQAGYMIAANPTQEGLFKLFALSHKKTGEVEVGFEELWSIALVSAENFFGKSSEEIESECWEVYKADIEKPFEDKSAYSYSSVVGEPGYLEGIIETEDLTAIEQIFLHLSEFRFHYFLGVLVILPLYFLLFQTEEVRNEKRYQKNNGKGAGAKFVSSKRTADTQVGRDDWQGTLKSGASELLSGGAYAAAIRSGAGECDDFRADYDKNLRQYYMDLANNLEETEETRQIAEAHLNVPFSKAMQAWDSGDFSAAEMYFEKAAGDPQLNNVGKCFALQKLSEFAEKNKDQLQWLKWQDKLLKELKKMPGYENVKGFDNFAKTYVKMLEVSQYLSNGGDSSEIYNHLKNAGESDSSAQKSIEVLKNVKGFLKQ